MEFDRIKICENLRENKIEDKVVFMDYVFVEEVFKEIKFFDFCYFYDYIQ